MILCNSFSLNMLASLPAQPAFRELTLEEVRTVLAAGFQSAVGHADTAAVFQDVLGLEVTAVRATLQLQTGQEAIIGQYRGPRLPEGCKILPDGAAIQWVHLTV